MKLIMTGLDHKAADLETREKFAVTKEKAGHILENTKNGGMIGGCVILSTCNRTELYASCAADNKFLLSRKLCSALGLDFTAYEPYLTERTGDQVMDHLCSVASGLDSQIIGDDQIITQVREALELSRTQRCTDSFLETMFRLAIQAAKVIKTNIISNSLGTSSVPEKAVEKIKTMCPLTARNALVIGNGKIGRLVSELLIKENMNVTITLRAHNKSVVQIPNQADTINYNERYSAVEKSDIVISATTSPHLTIAHNEMITLKRLPKIIVDLAVPRDVEPSVKNLSGVTLLTIDDISDNAFRLQPESVSIVENVIAEHIAKYNHWLKFKKTKLHAAGVNP